MVTWSRYIKAVSMLRTHIIEIPKLADDKEALIIGNASRMMPKKLPKKVPSAHIDVANRISLTNGIEE